MKRLLRHEFFKLFRSTAFRVTLLVITGLALLNAALSAVIATSEIGAMLNLVGPGYTSTAAAFGDFSNLSIFFSIILTVLVCNEIKNKTLKNTLIADFSREEVFFAKLLVCFVGVTIFAVLSAALNIAATTVFLGWGKEVTFEGLWADCISILLMGLVMCYAITAMLNFFAYWTKSAILLFVVAIATPIVLAVFNLIGALGNDFFEFISRFAYTNVLVNFFGDQSLENFSYYVISVALLLVPFGVGCCLLFKQQEVK